MSDDWTISASKIKSFKRCEEEFRLRYIEGHEESGPPSRWIRRGNAVHEAVEDALTTFEGSKPGSDILKGAYQANGGRQGYTLTEEDHGLVLECLEGVARYLRKNVEEIRGVELEVEFGVDSPTVTRDFGGYMDLATQDAVVDWKTGKSEDKAAGEAIQGAIYMAGYAYEYGEPPAKIDFVYLNPEHDGHPKVRTITPDDDLWESLLGKARTLLTAIENDDYTADPAPDKCHFCDFEVYCPASPVGAGNIDWEAYP